MNSDELRAIAEKEAAAQAGLSLPLTDVHRRLLEAAEAAGFGEADNSAIIRAFG